MPSSRSKSNKSKKGSSNASKLLPAAEERQEHEESKVFPPSYKLSNFDVICGRSKVSEAHGGNNRFRRIVGDWFQGYMKENLSREDRKRIISKVYDRVDKHGGKFLKQDFEGSEFVQISRKYAREKIAHALRDAGIKFLKEQEQLESEQIKGQKTKSSKNNHVAAGRQLGRTSSSRPRWETAENENATYRGGASESRRRRNRNRNRNNKKQTESTSHLSRTPGPSSCTGQSVRIEERPPMAKSSSDEAEYVPSDSEDDDVRDGLRRKRPSIFACKPRKKPKLALSQRKQWGPPSVWTAPDYHKIVIQGQNSSEGNSHTQEVENSAADEEDSAAETRSPRHTPHQESPQPQRAPAWEGINARAPASPSTQLPVRRGQNSPIQEGGENIIHQRRQSPPRTGIESRREVEQESSMHQHSVSRQFSVPSRVAGQSPRTYYQNPVLHGHVLAAKAGLEALLSRRQRVLATTQHGGQNTALMERRQQQFPSRPENLLDKLNRSLNDYNAPNRTSNEQFLTIPEAIIQRLYAQTRISAPSSDLRATSINPNSSLFSAATLHLYQAAIYNGAQRGDSTVIRFLEHYRDNRSLGGGTFPYHT